METSRGKEWNCTEKSKEEEECQMSSQPSTSLAQVPAKGTKRKQSVKDKDTNPKSKAQDTETPKPPRRKMIVPPLPERLPPVNEIHRDVLRGWCQKLKLSTKGQKLEAYKRIWEHVYPDQKPYVNNIPDTAKEARMKKMQKTLKMEKEEILCSEGTAPTEVTLTPVEHLPAHSEPPVLYEEVSTAVVTTSAPEAVLASWARIAASAGRVEAVKPREPPESYGDMWCVVHGRSLPADSPGWVRLQFHAGQAWVPEKKGRVRALFLLPACTFPPQHLEDNMLCPRCVHRNKVLSKSLQ